MFYSCSLTYAVVAVVEVLGPEVEGGVVSVAGPLPPPLTAEPPPATPPNIPPLRFRLPPGCTSSVGDMFSDLREAAGARYPGDGW